MRLSMDVPGAQYVDVFLDGTKLELCFAADDVLGIALIGVLDNGKEIPSPLHRDWQVGEFNRNGIVMRWAWGDVTFAFNPPEKRADAEAHWKDYIAHDALWAFGEYVALHMNVASDAYFEGYP